MTMTNEKSDPRAKRLGPPTVEVQFDESDSTPRMPNGAPIRNTPPREYRKLCRGCSPRRMTLAEIQRGNYGEADR